VVKVKRCCGDTPEPQKHTFFLGCVLSQALTAQLERQGGNWKRLLAS